jgi:2-oxoglutarate ferredoxin oxidoreductase subunit beta
MQLPQAGLKPNDYKSDLKPIWCPACGDFGVLQGLYRALAAIGRPPHEIAFISGIGCSSRIPGYTTAYGFNSVHGRALPIAQGVKLANPDLLVIVAGGDGDGFSIGGGHVPHVVRRNLDLTYLVMDNQVYGLTKGQLSPTSPKGLETVTSPLGSLEDPINPLLYMLAYGAGFVAQATPADMAGMTALIEEAIRYPGFSFVNIQSPCITFGEENQQLKVHKTWMKSLSSLKHDPTNLLAAMDLARAYGKELYTGVFYKNPNPPPTYEALVKLRQGAEAKKAGLELVKRPAPTVKPAEVPLEQLSLRDALDLAALVEEEARDRYSELADQLRVHRTPEAAAFFDRMSGLEEIHRSNLAKRRKEQFGSEPVSVTREMFFDIEAPEYDQARVHMNVHAALKVALTSETKAHAFFVQALKRVSDPAVVALFTELRDEEVEHQALVKAELAKLPPEPMSPPDAGTDEPVAH